MNRSLSIRRLRPRSLYPLDAIDLAYLAGIVDGEGSIVYGVSNEGRYHRAYIFVSSTSFSLIRWLLTTVGGRHTRQEPRGISTKVIYTWSVLRARDSYALLVALYPLLRIKGEEARGAIRALESWYGRDVLEEAAKHG